MKSEKRAPAKVNLFLRMAGRREDGYHLLFSCMQTLSLYDEISVEVKPGAETGPQVLFTSDCGFLTSDPKKNTAVAAAVRFLEKLAPERYTVSIDLKKNIPSQAGLGGGSSDAAAVLLALDELFPGRVTREDLEKIALSIGADVPYFLYGGTALCEGVGEIVDPMPELSGLPVLLMKPGRGVSTPACYKAFDEMGGTGIAEEEKEILIRGLKDQAPAKERMLLASRAWTNDLQAPAIGSVPEIEDGIRLLQAGGAAFAAMSGSGSCVFGIFEDEETIDALTDSPEFLRLLEEGWWAEKVHTV